MDSNIGQSFGLQTMSSELKNAKNYHRWLLSKVEPYLGERVLEIGMGDGSYTRFIKNKELIVGIDIAEDCVDFCKKEFSSYENIKCFKMDLLKDDSSEIKLQNLDSAFCFNVLEHVENDVDFLKNIKRIINKNGHLCIIVPAVSYLYGEMDRLAGHYRRYNKDDLAKVSKNSGWEVVSIEYINFLGGLGWFLNKFNKPKTLNDKSLNRQIIIFDKFILPITKIIDKFGKNFFGQSLLVVLKNN